MEQAAENAGAVLNEDFEQVTVYEEKSVVLRQMQICRYLTQADAVIDCAKLKTHGLTQYTGAVKNLTDACRARSRWNTIFGCRH